jgi:hypothetical protein
MKGRSLFKKEGRSLFFFADKRGYNNGDRTGARWGKIVLLQVQIVCSVPEESTTIVNPFISPVEVADILPS